MHTPLALTMGDPAGVGPELCLRALHEAEHWDHRSLVVFGDAGVLQRCSEHTGLPFPERVIKDQTSEAVSETAGLSQIGKPTIVDLGQIDPGSIQPGQSNAMTGTASYAYIQLAIDAALAGHVAGVTTGPISKEAIHAAGIEFPGHTEMFAERCQAQRSCMMQYSPEITCTFATVHVGYAEVPALLTSERIVDVIDLTVAALARLDCPSPRLVVCGLNPHAGEGGLFGHREEERLIIPAIEQCRQRGLQIAGPLPADTAFIPQRRAVTDAFICMYHDQGHIPVKALAFDSAVNTTLGLPIIRTSVDHGTAVDIAWQGVARPDSLFAALRLADRLAG